MGEVRTNKSSIFSFSSDRPFLFCLHAEGH
jgi:hypothetical protein